MGFFSNLFKRKKQDIQQEPTFTVNTNVNHNRDYQGITRPPANANPTKIAPQKTLQSKDIYTGNDIWQIASNTQIIREKQKMTQKDLAEKLGYKSASFVSRLELWELEKLTAEQVDNLANALNVTVTDLLKKTLNN